MASQPAQPLIHEEPETGAGQAPWDLHRVKAALHRVALSVRDEKVALAVCAQELADLHSMVAQAEAAMTERELMLSLVLRATGAEAAAAALPASPNAGRASGGAEVAEGVSGVSGVAAVDVPLPSKLNTLALSGGAGGAAPAGSAHLGHQGREAAGAERAAAEEAMWPLMNPGSFGHPELCRRPCIYYPMDNCENGSGCTFCHCEHPKREAHLDKQHRGLLRGLSVQDCMGIILPILKEKARALNIPPEIVCSLEQLGSTGAAGDSGGAPPSGAGARGGQQRAPPPSAEAWPQPRKFRKLHGVLRSMRFRSLVGALHRAALAPNGLECSAFEDMLDSVRFGQIRMGF